MRLVVLTAALAANLAASYILLVPTPPQWARWRLPILAAIAGSLAAMLAWSSRRPSTRSWAADGVGMALGVTSTILGIGGIILVGYGISLEISEAQLSHQALIHRMTHPTFLTGLSTYALLPGLTGVIGFWISRRRVREIGRVSTAGAAVRFSTVGIGLAILSAAAIASAVVYRWIIWA